MSPLDFLREYPALSVHELAVTPDVVCVAADSITPVAACPACGCPSDRVHTHPGSCA